MDKICEPPRGLSYVWLKQNQFDLGQFALLGKLMSHVLIPWFFFCFSGGVKREWVGVPREMFVPGSDKGKCVCARTEGPPSDDPDSNTNHGDLKNPNLREYQNCDPTSNECLFDA